MFERIALRRRQRLLPVPAVVVASIAAALLAPLWVCGAESVSPVRPMETALVGPLDGSRVQVGAPILLRVVVEWSEAGCTLRPGSIVQGRVVGVSRRSKTAKDGAVQVAFTAADCDGHPETPRAFTLVALVGGLGTSWARGEGNLAEAPPLANVPGLGLGSTLPGGGTGTMRSISAASDFNFTPTGTFRKQAGPAMPSRIMAGDVVALPRIALGVGRGVDGTTVVSGTSRDVKLERGTMLVLVPGMALAKREETSSTVAGTGGALGAGAPVSTRAGVDGRAVVGAAAAPRRRPPTEPPDETEVCSGVCTVVTRAEAGSPGTASSAAVARLPIHSLGYLPRERREAASFDEETTLTYLDAHHLLCTFDSHHLRERAGPDDEAVRTVRAVLIDPGTHTTRRVLDWRVRGDEQYLWRASGGHLLVHMGHELRLFDADLKPLRSIAVRGKVAWVVMSPSGEHLAVGTIHELHSEEEHQELERVLAASPEEEIEVHVFGDGFRELLGTTRSSRSPMPVLSDDGELRVRSVGHDRWTMSEYRWDRTAHTVATTKSVCRPTLTTPEHGLIFAIGCTTSGGRWYRMLRTDGHPLLKGESPSNEIEQTALSSAAGTFAVRIIKTEKAMTYGQPFRRADLVKEELGIYRSSDGSSVSALATTDFVPSEEAFAISPEGDQLALVGRDSILFFAVRH